VRSLFAAILLLVTVHVLAAVGLVGWLRYSGRLDRQRVRQVIAIFTPTIAQEQARLEQQEQDTQGSRTAELRLAELEEIGRGPRTVGDRLTADQQQRELAMRKMERLEDDIRALTRNLELTRKSVATEREALDMDRKAFDEFRQEEQARRQSENFQAAVRTYQSLKPKQAKAMLQVLLTTGRQGDVVDYLAAMQLRSRTAILNEFRGDVEAAQAAMLVQQLRDRGIQVESAPAVATPSALTAGGTT
jgi:hypothetical protein